MAENDTATEDDRLAVEIASGKTVRASAAAVGISERTAYRRLVDPAFQARVTELRSAVTVAAVGKLAAIADDAIESLHLLSTDGEGEATRARASELLLSFHLRYSERADVLERLAKLEAKG